MKIVVNTSFSTKIKIISNKNILILVNPSNSKLNFEPLQKFRRWNLFSPKQAKPRSKSVKTEHRTLPNPGSSTKTELQTHPNPPKILIPEPMN